MFPDRENDVVGAFVTARCGKVNVGERDKLLHSFVLSTCNLVPRPRMMPDLTVSLDWENRLKGARPDDPAAGFSNMMVSVFSELWVSSW